MTSLPKYRGKRRAAQLASLLLIALIPASGLLHVDLNTASFSILGNQIWWSNFALMFGFTLVLITAPVLTYVTIGSVWCGWACPQNLLGEWANNLTFKLLGKRASVAVVGEGLKVAAAKNKLINWMLLGISFMSVSLLLAIIPMLIFYTPKELWAIATLSNAAWLSPLLIYLFIAFLIFIDIAVARYFVCDYACFYRMGQRMFKTQDALHVVYDATRSSDCSKCNYCATACITRIEPTAIKQYDTCINCGECIDACDHLHEKTGTAGLLSFKAKPLAKSGSPGASRYQNMARALWRTERWMALLLLTGIGLTLWGLATQPKAIPEVPLAVQQKNREVARACNAQCAPQQASCKKRNMAECYRAAACRCECYLQQDPLNPAGKEWQECVTRNQAHAEAESLRVSARGAPNNSQTLVK